MRNTSLVPILISVAGFGAVSVALAAASSGANKPAAPKPIAQPTGKYTPEQAAKALLMYLNLPSTKDFGSKDAPNQLIASAQADMQGGLAADGIYGPKTKARGEVLTGTAWPSRPTAAAAPKATAKPAATATAAAASIPSHSVNVTTSPITAEALRGDPYAPPSSSKPTASAAKPAAAAPRPITPPGGTSSTPSVTAEVVSTQRSSKQAAQALYSYASGLIRSGRGAELGSKDKPNSTVSAAQRDMKLVAADGIYGPKTMARGKELTGVEFPSRYGTGTKISAAAPPVPPLTTANEQEERVLAAEGLLSYLGKAGADQGSKGKPSPVVKAAQGKMGSLVADGIYGPATRARGAQLTGKTFPPRK